MHERETLTRESHAGFKARREESRVQVARQRPLLDYDLTLLRWLDGLMSVSRLAGATRLDFHRRPRLN